MSPPKITIDGKEYVVDDGAGECRSVDNPSDRIPIQACKSKFADVASLIVKDEQKQQARWGHSYLKEDLEKVQTLKNFPRVPIDLEGVDVVYKAKILKKELKEKFPGVEFNVRTDKYSGGSSIDVRWVDGPGTAKVDEIVNKYSCDRGSDPMTDYFNRDNYANAQREISNYKQRLEEEIKDIDSKWAGLDKWEVERKANQQLNQKDLPISTGK